MMKRKRIIKDFVFGLIFGAVVLAAFFICATPANAAEVEDGENIYEEILVYASEDDLLALQRVVYWEAARAECPLETEVSVVETVLNRVLDPEWPDTIYGVCNDTRWGRQFVCKYYIPEKDYQQELIDDAISLVWREGPTELERCSYEYFATKKQSLGKNHVWKGARDEQGNPIPGKGMWFCEGK